MMQLKEIEPEALDIYVSKEHPEANFLQTSTWGKVYEKDGKKVFYLGLFEGKKLIGSSVVILKPAKRGRYLEILFERNRKTRRARKMCFCAYAPEYSRYRATSKAR